MERRLDSHRRRLVATVVVAALLGCAIGTATMALDHGDMADGVMVMCLALAYGTTVAVAAAAPSVPDEAGF